MDARSQNEQNAGVPSADFMRLLVQSERQLRVYITSLLTNWADAEDVLQETKIQLWERFAEYRPSGNFLAWARKIAFFQVLNHRNKVKRERAVLSQAVLELIAASSERMAAEADTRHAALAKCLKKLSQVNRTILWQCYASGATVKQVAESMGRSVRATQKTVAKLRVRLQDCVDQTIRREERP